ncbi:hypothetical protein HK414_16120 [Ramlibacter terrae]|uniref:LEPR-XLL domain-containing protein n=1 Tax=Ramlibacter terrae TaxID=2732511 RepID=A0ABX6P3H1_9BURK|nr:hypothetical protein HK414_16120 [Ramlibacter terrae]
MADQNAPARKWMALQASAASAGFVGVDGLVIAGESLSVQVNSAAADGSIVDFAADALEVATGTSSFLTLDMDGADGELLRATGHRPWTSSASSGRGRFRHREEEQRSHAVRRRGGEGRRRPADDRRHRPRRLRRHQRRHRRRAGPALDDVEFGLALMSERVAPGAAAGRSWTSLKAGAASVAFVGIEGIEVEATNLFVEINKGSVPQGPVVDHAATPLFVATGPLETDTIKFDMRGSRGELLRAGGELDIDLFGFVQMTSEFAFEKSSTHVVLNDPAATEVEVDLLTLGASGARLFAGVNGGTDDAMGPELTNVDFALAMMSDKAMPSRKWTAMYADVGSAGFVGLPGFELAVTDLELEINRASAVDGTVVDFRASPLPVSIGDVETLDLALDGSKGDSLKATGHLTIAVGGFFTVDGEFGIEKRSQKVTLSDGSEIDVDLLSIGGSGIDAFAGINADSEDEGDRPGLGLGDVDFAVALMTDKANPAHKYTAVQASAGLAAFVGIEDMTLEVSDFSVDINKGVLVAAVPPSVIKVNTQLGLQIDAATGSVEFQKGATTATAAVGSALSNAQVIANLKAAIGSLAGVGASNVQVTGTRIGGYTVEFIGTLSGVDVTGITANAGAVSASGSVAATVPAQGGVDEVKQITIEALRGDVPAVDVSVTQAVAMALGVSEIKSLVFSTPYSTTGTYTIALAGGGSPQTVRFHQNDVENNKAAIKKALQDLFGVTAGITVSFDQNHRGGHRYDIAFSGTTPTGTSPTSRSSRPCPATSRR